MSDSGARARSGRPPDDQPADPLRDAELSQDHPQYVLEVVRGKKRGKAFGVTTDRLVMGRGMRGSQEVKGKAIRFTEASVSREQAALVWDAQRSQYRIINRSQTNPTRVNGRPVDDVLLNEGDEIQMGSVVLKWRGAVPAHGKGVRRKPPSATSRSVAPSRPLTGHEGADATRKVTGRREPRASTGVLRSRPTRADMAQFFGQVGAMLEAGIPLARILGGLASKGGSPAVRALCERLLADVSRGTALWGAMHHCGAFSRLHVQTVRAGEMSGRLSRVLADLALWEERDLSLTRAVAGSLTYPATVLALGVVVLSVLGTRVFATLGPILAATGKPLPLITRILFALSAAVGRPVSLFVLSLVTCAVAWTAVRWVRTEAGSRAWDRLALRLPLSGPLIRKLFVARFSNHLRLLHSSGLPLLESVETSGAAVSNSWLRRDVLGALSKLRSGVTLSECLEASGCFPRLAIGLLSVGEAAGRIDLTLASLARLYDQEAYDALDRLVKALEPLIILALGVFVSVIVLGTLLPLYQVIQM